MSFPLTAILLTFNEQEQLPACLDSLTDLPLNIFVVDSFSTDGTLDILRQRNIPFIQHAFVNYSAQRNWAQQNCPFDTEWVLHLDAGEQLSDELREWLNSDFNPKVHTNGYLFSRRTYFWGRWIRYGGHYPNYHLRLFRKAMGHCEAKVYDQHFVVNGPLEVLPPGTDIVDHVASNLLYFTRSHAKWALMEAIEQVSGVTRGEVITDRKGTPIEKRRWQKNRIFERLPLFLRAFAYFGYRYFIRGGFRDGLEGLVFHSLQGLWFRFLVDAYILEIRHHMQAQDQNLATVIEQLYGTTYLPLIPST